MRAVLGLITVLCVCSLATDLRSNVVSSNSGALSFLVVGDWGGQPTAPYTTEAELRVAAAMAEIAAQNKTDIVFAVGDNFYDSGVKSVDDHRFQSTFENVFTDPALQVPWYLIAGNHDHRGNVSAQIAYSDVSPRWHFPAEYYSFRQVIDDDQGSFNILFIMIDTVNIDASGGDPDQVVWIKQQLEASVKNDTWVVIMGHYPFYSVAEHGSTPSLQDALSPLLEPYQVGAYFCGHDHNLQHIKVDGTHTQFFLSGAGHDLELNHNHDGSVPAGSLRFYYPDGSATSKSHKHGGFVAVRMWRDTMQVDYFDHDSNLLYTVTHNNPRTKQDLAIT